MEKSRGKKGKGAWHLTLGLKETICAAVGVVGLMMVSFALGALAGRGDIYRAAHSWGLLPPAPVQMAQWSPGGAPAQDPQAATPTVAAKAGEPVPAATPTSPATASVTTTTAAPAKGTPPAPVTASLTPGAAPATAKKKGKEGKPAPAAANPKSKEEEMRRVRQEVVRKLKFQNSFDTAPKAAPKPKDKSTVKTAAAKPQPAQVRVAQYRDNKAAKAKVAELQKQGIKATLKQTKDQKGQLFEVYKPAPAPGSGNLAQKPEKPAGAAKKTRPE